MANPSSSELGLVPPSRRPLRIFFAAGPGDVIATYRHWQSRVEDPTEIVPTYSGQFYELCERGGHQGLVISTHHRREGIRDGRFRIIHRPRPPVGGWRYHLQQFTWSLRLTWDALRFRADVVIVHLGMCHLFGLALLPLARVKVVPCLFNTFWPKDRRLSRMQRLVLTLTGRFLRRQAWAILSMSRAITRQVDELTGGRHGPIVEFLPVYRRDSFATMPPPPAARSPFRVLYVGRIETDKGVFLALELARRFAAAGRTDIEFDLCGAGSALEELRKKAGELRLTASFRTHGHCGRAMLQEMYAAAHVVIVPTTAQFTEGFNQVMTEAVLSGRPVVTSDACPAVEYLPDTGVIVPTDDTDAYEKAILQLCDERAYYESVRANCAAVSGPFYDPANGWRAAVEGLLERVSPSTDASSASVTSSRPAAP
jgi:glycosyltransferase involved in cell wall biosynthesis